MDNKYNSSLEDMQKIKNNELKHKIQQQQQHETEEEYDNSANEELEEKLCMELKTSEDGDAICVYKSNDRMHVVPANENPKFIPVHFAKTNNGTFFWTSMMNTTIISTTSTCSTEVSNEFDKSTLKYFGERWAQA